MRELCVRVDRKKKLKRLRKGASDEEDNLPYDEDVPVSDKEEDDRFQERRRAGTSGEHKLGVPPGYDDGFGNWSIPWQIFDLDKNYGDLCQRRKQLLESAKHATDKGVPNLVTDDVMNVVPTCDDERLLGDAERYLHLAIELGEALSAGMNDLGDDRARRHFR